MSKNIELKEMIIMSIIVGLKHYKVPKELALVLLNDMSELFTFKDEMSEIMHDLALKCREELGKNEQTSFN